MNLLLSKTINNLRFPLCIGVVLIHSQLASCFHIKADDILYHSISYYFSEIIGRTAVPLFFFISGFLLYNKLILYSKEDGYISNMLKRLHTLLIPYIMWNLLIVAIYQIIYSLFPYLSFGGNIPPSEYTLTDWLHVFGFGSHPADAPLWFIRDLMVVSLISPILWYLLKSGPSLLIIGILCWILGYDSQITGFSTTAILFFAIGIYSNKNQNKWTNYLSHNYLIINIFFILLSFIDVYLKNTNNIHVSIHNICISTGGIALFSLCIHLTKRNIIRSTPFLISSCFFIYAFHYLPLILIQKITCTFIHTESNIFFVLIYFMCPIIILTLSLIIFYIISKYLPTITKYFTGNRSRSS